jgi:hypothetical protein
MKVPITVTDLQRLHNQHLGQLVELVAAQNRLIAILDDTLAAANREYNQLVISHNDLARVHDDLNIFTYKDLKI